MSASLKKTIENFPEILKKNSLGLMHRTISKTKDSINSDLKLSNAAACNFFLQTSTDELCQKFKSILNESLRHINENQTAVKIGDLRLNISFSIESNDNKEQLAIAEMKSLARFEQLCSKGKQHQINGIEVYNVQLFVNAMREAFNSTNFQSSDLLSIIPHAIRSLDSELVNLYERLNSLEV